MLWFSTSYKAVCISTTTRYKNNTTMRLWNFLINQATTSDSTRMSYRSILGDRIRSSWIISENKELSFYILNWMLIGRKKQSSWFTNYGFLFSKMSRFSNPLKIWIIDSSLSMIGKMTLFKVFWDRLQEIQSTNRK